MIAEVACRSQGPRPFLHLSQLAYNRTCPSLCTLMSLQVMLAFIQVIVSGVLAGAARWTGWSWYGLNSYTYTYAPWMGVGIVALLLGLLSECRSACMHACRYLCARPGRPSCSHEGPPSA